MSNPSTPLNRSNVSNASVGGGSTPLNSHSRSLHLSSFSHQRQVDEEVGWGLFQENGIKNVGVGEEPPTEGAFRIHRRFGQPLTWVPFPRLLDRQGAFEQSMGRLKIHRQNTASTYQLRWSDAFHSIINWDAWKVLVLAAAIIIFSWLVFACFFWHISTSCNLRLNTFLQAFYLALETVETIGYGVPDGAFDRCAIGIFVLGASALWESLVNAVIIAIVYTRVSRPTTRATTVVFSAKAVISQVGGFPHFGFQVCDIRKHQLIEAHVRLYCIEHATTGTGVLFQTRAMRLQHPDDELGGMLLLALPQLVLHRIDPWSPLCPLECQRVAGGNPANSFEYPDVIQRASDSENANRELPPGMKLPVVPGIADICQRLVQGELEILCLVEGIDPATSNTLQARHSYTSDDIIYNGSFQKCVSRGANGAAQVDLGALHEVVPIAPDTHMLVQSMP